MQDQQAASIPALAERAADKFGDQLAIADGETQISYAQLFDASGTVGAGLVASGIEPGDRVAIWAFNSAEWVIAALGLLSAGAVLVPINTRFKGVEAGDILRRSNARALVTVTDFLGTDYVEMVRGSGVELPALNTVVIARGPVPAGAIGWSDLAGRAGKDTLADLDRRRRAVGRNDPSDILFTSGTTGTPKGVVMTHGRTLRVATDWAEMTGLNSDDRYLMINPYFHMFGLKAGILACVAGGAAMLPEAVFDVDRVLTRVQAERVTVLPGPPTLYQSILDHPDRGRFDLSSLRLAVTGAADVPVRLIERIYAELPFSRVISGYGLTEGGTATATSESDSEEIIATTAGRARPGFELRIVGTDGAELPAGETGELTLRGASVMSHYLDDPQATAATLSADGWLRTGDLGTVDEDGLLRIVGRAKDMIIVGGFNAYPAEIENLLHHHPDIRDVAVVGIPDQRLGEVPMAFVVLRPEAACTGPDIVRWAREQMANYKAPRIVQLVDELPVNATGKVQKDVLRERAAQLPR